jgi:hypothetical protein
MNRLLIAVTIVSLGLAAYFYLHEYSRVPLVVLTCPPAPKYDTYPVFYFGPKPPFIIDTNAYLIYEMKPDKGWTIRCLDIDGATNTITGHQCPESRKP